ncbi:MAG: hypothetical protein HY236_14075 [Acidobacteria bacterium]|nr:hypothetical protein [Acidobacteriota bacterium]
MRENEGAEKLELLWEAYRRVTPEPEPGPNFMPELWARIDASRSVSWVGPLKQLVARLLPVTAALILAMGAYIWIPQFRSAGRSATPDAPYVDVLAAEMMEDQQPAVWLTKGEEQRK